MNVGEEIFGKGRRFSRPVLVFKKFSRNSFLGLPLTSREKNGSWYIEFLMQNKRNWLMLNQARVLDARRLNSRITTIGNDIFVGIKHQFLKFYGS